MIGTYELNLALVNANIEAAERDVLKAQEEERRQRARRDGMIQDRERMLRRQAMLRHPAGKALA